MRLLTTEIVCSKMSSFFFFSRRMMIHLLYFAFNVLFSFTLEYWLGFRFFKFLYKCGEEGKFTRAAFTPFLATLVKLWRAIGRGQRLV